MAELKEMGEQSAFLAQGAFVVRSLNGEEVPAHIASLLNDICNGRPGVAH